MYDISATETCQWQMPKILESLKGDIITMTHVLALEIDKSINNKKLMREARLKDKESAVTLNKGRFKLKVNEVTFLGSVEK